MNRVILSVNNFLQYVYESFTIGMRQISVDSHVKTAIYSFYNGSFHVWIPREPATYTWGFEKTLKSRSGELGTTVHL